MPYTFQDKTFPAVQHADMSPEEMEWVEAKTGFSYARIVHQQQTCLCDHGLGAHLRFDNDGKRLDDVSCKNADCGCEDFAADVPSKVNFALMFTALKRVDPSASWDEVSKIPQREWVYTAEPENPTPPAPPSLEE